MVQTTADPAQAMVTSLATLARLLVSQLCGAAGDTLGSRLSRVDYHGSPERMMLATSLVGVLLSTSCLFLLHRIGVAKVRFGYILSAPDLWVANGILTAAYNWGEASLLLYSFGAVIKSVTPIVAPAALFVAERQGWLAQLDGPGGSGGGQGAASQLIMIVVGTVGALVLASLGWKWRDARNETNPESRHLAPTSPRKDRRGNSRDAEAVDQPPTVAPGAGGVTGADTLLPATVTLVLCNTGWNAMQRVSFTKHHMNAYEWVLLDKVVGGAFTLAFLVIKAKRSGEPLEWGAALQNSVASAAAAVSLSTYVLLQLLRLALVFLIVGTGSSGVATGTFLVTVVRVALAAMINLLITWLAPKLLGLSREDVTHLMAPTRVRRAVFGLVLIMASVGKWCETASGTTWTSTAAADSRARQCGSRADIDPPLVLALGDWGVMEGDWFGVVPRAMMEFAGAHDAVILNLGDSFYPDGISTEAQHRRREAAYAAQFGHNNRNNENKNNNETKPAERRYHSVLGNHDYLGNVTATVEGGAVGWLGFERTNWFSWHDPQLDATFVAIDTNFVQKTQICFGKASEQACRATMDLMQTTQLAWLERVLADAQKRGVTWCIVFGHHPIIGAGRWAFYQGDKRLAAQVLAPLFEKYDVALYLSGHDHVQQLYVRSGVRYAISGAGGAKLDDEPLMNTAGTNAQNATLHLAEPGHGFAALHFDTELDVLCVHFMTTAACTDVASFVDVGGCRCSSWEGYSCDVSPDRHMYSKSDMAAVRKNCPRSCGSCKAERGKTGRKKGPEQKNHRKKRGPHCTGLETPARPAFNRSREMCLLGSPHCHCMPSKLRRCAANAAKPAFTENQLARRRHLSTFAAVAIETSGRPGIDAPAVTLPPSSSTALSRDLLSAPDTDFKQTLRELYESEGVVVRIHECSDRMWTNRHDKDEKWPEGPYHLPDPDPGGLLGDWEQECIDDELVMANTQGGTKIASSFLAPGLPTATYRASGRYPDGTPTEAGWLMDPRRLTVMYAFPHDCFCGKQGFDDENRWLKQNPKRIRCGTLNPALNRWPNRMPPERNASEYATRRVDISVSACANAKPNSKYKGELGDYFRNNSCWLPSIAEAATYQRAWVTELRRRGLAKSKCHQGNIWWNEIRVVYDLSAVIGVFFIARSAGQSNNSNHLYAQKAARTLAATWGRKEPAPIVAIIPDLGIDNLKPFDETFVFPAPAT